MIEYADENIVVKIGGASLFGGVPFLEPIRSIVRPAPEQRLFVLLGGGETVESMRSLHAQFPQLDVEQMHWRCVRLLDATWEIGCELFQNAIGVPTWEELLQASDGPTESVYIVRTSAFYSPQSLHQIPPALRPNHNWDTTTDVLSWILARLIGASELRITKRCPIDPEMPIHEAARLGMIDPELARLVAFCEPEAKPRIRFVHLRENIPPQ